MNKPAENAALVAGVTITVADFVSHRFFHVQLTPTVLSNLPIVVGAVPHAITAFVDSFRTRKSIKAALQAAAIVAEQAALAAKVDSLLEAKIAELAAGNPTLAAALKAAVPHTGSQDQA